ncbi:MAG: hypothetical protein LC667_15910, partial [Thioalkalivibrio sp.]|nr:hypothetical protein [Thioalkalivibrio sp.]
VHLQAHVDNHEGRLGTPRSQRWIDAIEEHVRSMCRSAGTQALGGALPIDPIALRRPQSVRSHVTDVERHLARARTRATEFVKDNVDSIVNRAMKLDGERAWLAKGSGAHRINYWLFDESGPIHPLAVRYVLYEVEESLTARIASRHESPREVTALRDAHEAKYDDPATPERETAVDRASEVLHRGLLARLLRKNALEDFADAYASDARRHYDDLQHHLELALRREVFRRLQGEVGAFLQEWEGFFAQLADVRDDFAADAIRLERVHDEQNDGTTEYVLAAADHKQRLWAGVREAIDWTQDDEVSRIAYDGVYRYYLETRRERRDRAITPFVERVREALRSRLVAMPQRVPDSIGEALRREAEFAGVDAAKHARARIEAIPRQTVPFLQLRPTHKYEVEPFEFWGVHPDTLDTLPDAARTAIAQVTDDDTDPAFSVHELIFYRSRYLIEATDLASFTPGREYGTMRDVDGPYYLSYRDRIAKMLRGGVTPHLDTTWDAALPNFWDERFFAARVTILGMATGIVRRQKGAWVASVPSKEDTKINENLQLAKSDRRGSLSDLIDAAVRSDDLDRIAREVGNVAKEHQREDQGRYGTKLHHHRFVKAIRRLPNDDGSLFALIAESYLGAPDSTPSTRSARVQSLFRTFADILATYVHTVEGDEDRARRRIHEILEKGLEDAFTNESTLVRGVPAGVKTSLRELVASYKP